MDDTTQTSPLQQSLRQELEYDRHLQANRNSVRRIPYLMEFAAARLKAQMLGGQAKTIALRGYERADHE